MVRAVEVRVFFRAPFKTPPFDFAEGFSSLLSACEAEQNELSSLDKLDVNVAGKRLNNDAKHILSRTRLARGG